MSPLEYEVVRVFVTSRLGIETAEYLGQLLESAADDGDAERWAFLEKNPWRAIDILIAQCSTDPTRWGDQAREAIDRVRGAI